MPGIRSAQQISVVFIVVSENSRLKSMASTCRKPGVLAEEFRKFVDDPKSNGTVYVAFGTVVFWEYAPRRILDAFFEAFERLKEYRIIFVYNGLPRKVSGHIRLVKWAPQLEILSHSKTKVVLLNHGCRHINF